MLFRIVLTASVVVAALVAGGVAVELLLAGRVLVGFAMVAAALAVAGSAVGTWFWSSQQHPVKGIHY